MERWDDGTIKSQNNFFTLRPEKSVVFEDRNRVKFSQGSSSHVEKARENGYDVGNLSWKKRAIDLDPKRFHVYALVKK